LVTIEIVRDSLAGNGNTLQIKRLKLASELIPESNGSLRGHLSASIAV